MLAEFVECFDGIGELKGTYHITLDPEVEPVINSPRRLPIALKDEIKAELASMEHQGVIEKVEEDHRTDWLNSIVYQRKSNGKLRICLDPCDLNTAIKREYHVTPTLEDIIPKMSGAKYFSTVDAKCGYFNVRLDEQSSSLTTFNSPYGRYRFKRMPFGLKMSQDIFRTRIDQLVEGLTGVVAIADDIVIFGATQEEHDENLRRLLARCREHGLMLNPDKSQISQPEVKFYGIICSAEGVPSGYSESIGATNHVSTDQQPGTCIVPWSGNVYGTVYPKSEQSRITPACVDLERRSLRVVAGSNRSFLNYSEPSSRGLPSRREIVSHRAAIAFQADLSVAELDRFYHFRSPF